MPRRSALFAALALLASLAGCAAPGASVPARQPRGLPIEHAWLAPDVFMMTRYLYYELTGTTGRELRAGMNQVGPIDGGSHSDAYTHTYVRWGYKHDKGPTSCAIRSLNVELQVTYAMPEWIPPANATPGLDARWTRYEAALFGHETGHRDLGVRAAIELAQLLRSLPAFPSCDELSKAAHQVWDARFAQLKDEHLQYDKQTRHGATQGVVFP